MRRAVIAWMGIVVLAACLAPVRAQESPAEEAGPLTLGAFAARVVAGLGLQPASATVTPEGAAWILLQKGIRIRPDLDSPLTEADAVGVLNGLGFRIRTTTPSRVMSRDRVEILLGAFIKPKP